MTEFTGARGIVLDLETLQVERVQEQMMETVVSQCVKRLYSVLLDMKWGAVISIKETRVRDGCLREATGNLGPRTKSFSPGLEGESAVKMFFPGPRVVRATVKYSTTCKLLD